MCYIPFFSCDNDCVIWRLYFDNIWYGPHQASFFSANSVVTMIMSSGDYLLTIYDMVITRHHFSMQIQLWQWLCHPETIFWKYIIWSWSSIIFQLWQWLCHLETIFWQYMIWSSSSISNLHCPMGLCALHMDCVESVWVCVESEPVLVDFIWLWGVCADFTYNWEMCHFYSM